MKDEAVGDGTTSVVLLAAELLKNSVPLLLKGVHPTWIIQGYRMASEFALRVIKEIKIPLGDTKEQEETLYHIAKTSLGSKVTLSAMRNADRKDYKQVSRSLLQNCNRCSEMFARIEEVVTHSYCEENRILNVKIHAHSGCTIKS